MILSETELVALFNNSKIPIYRGHAPVGQKVPFLLYHVDYNGNFGADDITHQKVPGYRLDLYNTAPDLTVRGNIETTLTNAGIFWRSDETDVPEESLFITYYYFGGLK